VVRVLSTRAVPGCGGASDLYGPDVKVYTKAGDDGTTGLFYGGRVAKDSELPTAYGSVDEAQAVIGLARAHAVGELDHLLVGVLRDLWVLMAELATALDNRHKLEPGATSVTQAMVERLEAEIDGLDERFETPKAFTVPGGNVTSAWLDLARTAVRRAERHALPAAPAPSLVVPYLNRLSDLLWTMARWQDSLDGSTLRARDVDAGGQT
jgi:cob(I)alamin adenosyltransferase